jgi:hypothetical protein
MSSVLRGLRHRHGDAASSLFSSTLLQRQGGVLHRLIGRDTSGFARVAVPKRD